LRGPKAAAQESQTGFNSFDIPGGKADRWGPQSLRLMDDMPCKPPQKVVSRSWDALGGLGVAAEAVCGR
jgi:hypothetical protein